MPKLAKLRLTLDVDIDPQGVPIQRLKINLNRVVQDACNNGTFTGDSPATVEGYHFIVSERKDRQRSVKTTK